MFSVIFVIILFGTAPDGDVTICPEGLRERVQIVSVYHGGGGGRTLEGGAWGVFLPYKAWKSQPSCRATWWRGGGFPAERSGRLGWKKKKDDSVGAVYSPLLLGVCAMPKQTTFALLGVTGIYYTLKMKRPQFAMCQLSVCVRF